MKEENIIDEMHHHYKATSIPKKALNRLHNIAWFILLCNKKDSFSGLFDDRHFLWKIQIYSIWLYFDWISLFFFL